MHALVEHLQQQMDDGRPHPGTADSQGIGPHQEHGSYHPLRQQRPHAHGVAAYQVDL